MAALQSSSPFSAIDLTKDFDTVSREGLWKILARLGCPPKFLTILRQLHEGQMGQVKYNGTLTDSFPITNSVTQGCVSLFSILFNLMLQKAKEDLVNGIFIHFRTDGSIFNLRRLLAHTKTIEVLIVVLLFTDDCALLTHTQEALQYIVKAAKAFSFTISLKKTEVLHQPPPRGVYSPPQINIEGTSLNSLEHFTYLGSIISTDATVNKDLDNRLTRASNAFGRTTPSTSPQRSRFTVQLWSLPYCKAARHGCCTASRSGCWSDFINAACVPSWGSSRRSTSPTRRSSSEPACQVLSVNYYSSSSAGLAMWPEWKTQGCPKLSSSASCGKAIANVELQKSDTKTS